MWRGRALVTSALRGMSSSAAGKLHGKVAVVTAATEGIGFAIAERLAADGARVLLSSRKLSKVEQAVKQLQEKNLTVKGCVCHVGKQEDRLRMLQMANDEFGGIDILVSNAGTNPHFGPILDITESQWDKTFDTNVKSSFFLIKETMPYLEKREGGSIILLSSISSYVLNPMSLGVYSISKLALIGVTKALATQCAESNVRINTLCPGLIKTKFSGALLQSEEMSNAMINTFIPQKRAGTPHDVSGAASFLASEDSSYITGETIVIAGGMSSHI